MELVSVSCFSNATGVITFHCHNTRTLVREDLSKHHRMDHLGMNYIPFSAGTGGVPLLF